MTTTDKTETISEIRDSLELDGMLRSDTWNESVDIYDRAWRIASSSGDFDEVLHAKIVEFIAEAKAARDEDELMHAHSESYGELVCDAVIPLIGLKAYTRHSQGILSHLENHTYIEGEKVLPKVSFNAVLEALVNEGVTERKWKRLKASKPVQTAPAV